MPQLTHSPDPVFLGPGAGTAAYQANLPRLMADYANGGYVIYASKGAVKVGDRFPNETEITAEDATNAAKLAGLGYVAAPPGTAWATGMYFVVSADEFKFHWTGSAWAAGPKPAAQST